MKYFTADPHYGHTNIIDYCDRPFRRVDEMNRTQIARHRAVVTPDDDVYIVGDFTIQGPNHRNYVEQIVRELTGHKHLILGNHDKFKYMDYHEMGFEGVHSILKVELVHPDHPGVPYDVMLAHDPAWATTKVGCWLTGHTHGLFKTAQGGRVISVCRKLELHTSRRGHVMANHQRVQGEITC